MKWLLLLGLLCVYGIWGQGLAKVEENRAVVEELLAQFERHERAVYWVAMASGMALLISLGLFVLRDANRQLVAQLMAGYDAGELDLRDTSGEIAVVLGDGPRLREKTAGRAWTSTTRRARCGLRCTWMTRSGPNLNWRNRRDIWIR